MILGNGNDYADALLLLVCSFVIEIELNDCVLDIFSATCDWLSLLQQAREGLFHLQPSRVLPPALQVESNCLFFSP